MACKSVSHFDDEENRYYCQVTGDTCVYMFPDSARCAKDYNEGPDAVHEDDEEGSDKA